MKRLIALLFVVCTILCGCSEKKEIIPYDLAICDVAMNEMCDYLNGFENENYKVEKIDFTAEQLAGVITALQENNNGLNSITLYGKNITDEMAHQTIAFADTLEIPVTFAFSNISTDTLKSYDKAFCITTNYTHAAEITAKKIDELWDSNIIIDADKNMLFAFASVKTAELSAEMQTYYDTLVAGIELYGVPMEIGGDISPDEVTSGDSLVAFNATNEALIVIDKASLPYINEYTPYSSGVELITFSEGSENIFAENSSVLHCFVDYDDYKLAADEIIKNFNNRQYPLITNSFPVIERTVYIPATV